MLRLIRIILMQPHRLNEALVQVKPTYRQLFFRLVLVMMLPILVQSYQVTEHIKSDIGQIQQTIPAFTLKNGELSFNNPKQKPYVFLGDYFNLLFNPSDKNVRLLHKDKQASIIFTKEKVMIEPAGKSYVYKDYPRLTDGMLRQMLVLLKESSFEYLFFLLGIAFVLCYISMIFLQFVYRMLFTFIAMTLGMRAAPFIVQRMTASLSILPILLVSIWNCFFHMSWSYFGVGLVLFALTCYYVLFKTRKYQIKMK